MKIVLSSGDSDARRNGSGRMIRQPASALKPFRAALLVATALPAIQAHAQTAPAPATPAATADTAAITGTDVNGDILVQARRREERLQSVPIAITALTNELLERRSVVTLQDLTLVTPGLNVAPALSRDQPAFVIRGLQRLASGQGAPAVVTYFADVPLAAEGSLLPTFDVASLQVLKGPQGTLFGRNTTGGAVLLYPVTPTYDVNGYAKATYGRFNERTLEGAINVPIVDGKVALRVAAQIARRDGYTKNLGVGDDLDDRHTDAVRATLLLEPTATLRNVTIFDYYRAREAGTATVLSGTYPNVASPFGGLARIPPFSSFYDCGRSASCDVDLALQQQKADGVRTVRYGVAPRADRDIWGAVNTTTLDLGTVTLKNIFGYRRTLINNVRDYDGSPLQIFDTFGRISTSQITNEFQILGNAFQDKLDYIFGAFYLSDRPEGMNGAEVRNFIIVPFVPATLPEGYSKTRSKALFGQLGYKLDGLVDGLRLNGGFRYTWDDIKGCQITRPLAVGFAGSIGACQTNGGNISKVSFSAPTWSLGLDWQANRDLLFYGVTRRGYRSGGYNRSGLNPILAAYENFRPEKVTDIELGAKTSWRTGGLSGTFNVAAYRSKYSNIQVTTVPGANFDKDNNPANDSFTLIINAAKATIKGVEAEASITLAEGLTIGGFLNYTDAYYNSFDVAALLKPLLGANPAAGVFPFVPKWSGGANFHYGVALPNTMGTVALDVNHFRSGTVLYNVRPNDPNETQKPYSTTNAKLSWDNIAGTNIGAGLFARNLFKATYAQAGGFIVPTFTTTTLVYNEPRIVGVELRYRFGAR